MKRLQWYKRGAAYDLKLAVVLELSVCVQIIVVGLLHLFQLIIGQTLIDNLMDSSVENVEIYTKEVPKMCKIPHFPHFN